MRAIRRHSSQPTTLICGGACGALDGWEYSPGLRFLANLPPKAAQGEVLVGVGADGPQAKKRRGMNGYSNGGSDDNGGCGSAAEMVLVQR